MRKLIPLLILLGAAIYAWWIFQPQQMIVGAWQGQQGKVEFYSDGTIVGPSGTGNYSILSNDQIKIELAGLGSLLGAAVTNYKLTNQHLTIIGQDKRAVVLDRADSSLQTSIRKPLEPVASLFRGQ